MHGVTCERKRHNLCVSFCLINKYLQTLPLYFNTTFSLVHVIHFLSFWSVFGTTFGFIFRNMAISVFENQLP